ncbi:MAG: hypothetical protein H6618_08240 [Deltaproteobacteria bacterium]|nr:hypothetical protein [Deltaproteobacteria bacterium]
MKLSRRQFGTFITALGLSKAAFRTSAQESDEEDEEKDPCNIDIVATETAISCDPDKCIFWIDGLYAEKSRVNVRANLSFLLKFPQSSEHYIDKVVLADGDKNTLGVRYFEDQDKISSGYPPYLIFNNIDLSSSRRFFLVFRVIEGSEIVIYRKTLSESSLRKSRLDHGELPARLRLDLDRSHSGIISSPIQFRTALGPASVRKHAVRARLMQLSSENQFSIQISFLHDDENASHFSRYFIVTDPVGRILGLLKRDFGDNRRDYVTVSALTESERNHWGLTMDKVAKINDCPYVMIFVDDVAESLSKTVIWLR